MVGRRLIAALVLAGAGATCRPSPCARVCVKLADCHLVADESKCESDCAHPPEGGKTCSNEDAIATCIEQASCDDLTHEDSRLKCPACR